MILPARPLFEHFGFLQTWIVGIAYHDGAKALTDPEVFFERDPDNPFDPNAVAVFTKGALQIGYLPRYDAAYLSPLMAEGVLALSGRVTGPENGARLPVEVRVHATSRVLPLIEPDHRDDWRALMHNALLAAWTRADSLSARTLEEFRNRLRAPAHEQDLYPKTQLLYRLLKHRIALRAREEIHALRQRVTEAVSRIAFGRAHGWPQLSVIPLDAPADVLPPAADAASTALVPMEDGEELPRELLRQLTIHCSYPPGARGLCVLTHGEFYAMDWFDDPAAAQVMWYATILDALRDALDETEGAGAPIDARARLLDALSRATLAARPDGEGAALRVEIKTDRLHGHVRFNGSALVRAQLRARSSPHA